MANPMVLFENVFADANGTLTADSEQSGFEVDTLIDWRLGNKYRWKSDVTTSPQYVTMDLGLGNSAAPDTVIIGGHNLATACPAAGFTIQYQVTAGSGYLSWAAQKVPTSNVVEFQTGTAVSARYWRLRLQDTGALLAKPEIGVLTLGRRLEFDEGTPESIDPYGQSVVTDDGQEFGSPLIPNVRYKRKAFGIEWPEPGLTKTSFFQPSSGVTFDDDFTPHAINQALPFWFSWDLDDTVDPGPYLCRTRSVSSPFILNYKRRTLSAVFEAFREIA